MNLHAEGVEQTGELAELRALGADLAQGYLWSPAVPADSFPLPRSVHGESVRPRFGYRATSPREVR
jgi:EAL domain-containing protein (putative c-di-GMP-specific phosphodiesterase class I)